MNINSVFNGLKTQGMFQRKNTIIICSLALVVPCLPSKLLKYKEYGISPSIITILESFQSVMKSHPYTGEKLLFLKQRY